MRLPATFTPSIHPLDYLKSLYSIGTTEWEYVEPIAISIENEYLVARLEQPLGERSVRQIKFRQIENPLNEAKPTPDGSFDAGTKSAPHIDERMECENALTIASRTTR